MSKVCTARDMREMADKEKFKCSFVTRTLNGGIILDCTSDVRAMLRQAADSLEREAAKETEIERLKAHVACFTKFKNLAEKKMTEIAALRALVGELAQSLDASCDCHSHCDGCKMADESKFDCPDKAWRALVAKAREVK